MNLYIILSIIYKCELKYVNYYYCRLKRYTEGTVNYSINVKVAM